MGAPPLVTGSTAGIGVGIAQRLAAAGALVIVNGRDQVRGDDVVARIAAAGSRAWFVGADLGDGVSAIAALAEQAGSSGRRTGGHSGQQRRPAARARADCYRFGRTHRPGAGGERGRAVPAHRHPRATHGRTGRRCGRQHRLDQRPGRDGRFRALQRHEGGGALTQQELGRRVRPLGRTGQHRRGRGRRRRRATPRSPTGSHRSSSASRPAP